MSGKSTYLYQLALLVIMCQIGCHIPATGASIHIIHSLYLISPRLHYNMNQSQFDTELYDIIYVLTQLGSNNHTNNSLLLFDELGVSTNILDGISLVWSILENILQYHSCTTLIATHYMELCDLQQLYPAHVQNKHFDVSVTNSIVQYRYQLLSNEYLRTFDYGIYIAESCHILYDIIQQAKQLILYIKQKRQQSISHTSVHKYMQQQQCVIQLKQLKHTILTDDELKQKLTELGNKYLADIDIDNNKHMMIDDDNIECNTEIHTIPLQSISDDSITVHQHNNNLSANVQHQPLTEHSSTPSGTMDDEHNTTELSAIDHDSDADSNSSLSSVESFIIDDDTHNTSNDINNNSMITQ